MSEEQTLLPKAVPSAPPAPFHLSLAEDVVYPIEIVFQPDDAIVPDRIVQDQIRTSVIRSNQDGEQIVHYDRIATAASNNVAKMIHQNIQHRVVASNYDTVQDLTVRPTGESDFYIEPNFDRTNNSTNSQPSGKGYQFSEYKSMYEDGEYKTQDYKSMYD
jgi:hypothetical protein